MYYDKNVAA